MRSAGNYFAEFGPNSRLGRAEWAEDLEESIVEEEPRWVRKAKDAEFLEGASHVAALLERANRLPDAVLVLSCAEATAAERCLGNLDEIDQEAVRLREERRQQLEERELTKVNQGVSLFESRTQSITIRMHEDALFRLECGIFACRKKGWPGNFSLAFAPAAKTAGALFFSFHHARVF